MLKIFKYSFLLILLGCSNQKVLFDNENSNPIFINPYLTINYRLDSTENINSLNDQFSAIWSDDMSFIVQPNGQESQPNSSKFKVNSCESMLIARKNNYDLIDIPSSGPYNAMYVDCQAMFLIINEADPYTKSYIQDYVLNKTNIQTLPKDMALIISTSTYNDIHTDKKIKVLEEVNHIVKVTQKNKLTSIAEDDSGGVQEISILAKGDFNHDAIEDMMLSVSNSVIGGSYTSYYLYILTKTEKDGDWIVLDEYPKHP
jgi:hypothetical protein